MSIELSSPSAFDWPDRLRRAAIILLVAGLALGVLVAASDVALTHALIAFICIGGAALVPWRLNESTAASEPVVVDPAETEMVRALIGGMPDAAMLLDRIRPGASFQRRGRRPRARDAQG